MPGSESYLLGGSVFAGPEVVVDPTLGRVYRQVRFPRSKRKRIRKKWRADRANWAWVYTRPIMLETGRPGSHKARGAQGALLCALGLLHNQPWLLIFNPPGKAVFDKVLARQAERARAAIEEAAIKRVVGNDTALTWRKP